MGSVLGRVIWGGVLGRVLWRLLGKGLGDGSRGRSWGGSRGSGGTTGGATALVVHRYQGYLCTGHVVPGWGVNVQGRQPSYTDRRYHEGGPQPPYTLTKAKCTRGEHNSEPAAPFHGPCRTHLPRLSVYGARGGRLCPKRGHSRPPRVPPPKCVRRLPPLHVDTPADHHTPRTHLGGDTADHHTPRTHLARLSVYHHTPRTHTEGEGLGI